MKVNFIEYESIFVHQMMPPLTHFRKGLGFIKNQPQKARYLGLNQLLIFLNQNQSMCIRLCYIGVPSKTLECAKIGVFFKTKPFL